MTSHHRELSFATYASFDDLAADPAMMDALIEQYQRVFGESEVWGETYSRDDVLAKLRDELAGEASLRICHDRSGTVLGFCWAQLLGAAEVMRAVDTIKFYQSIALPDLPDRIDALLSGTRVLYVHDLGIARSARGRIPLTQLIYPVLADVAGRTGHWPGAVLEHAGYAGLHPRAPRAVRRVSDAERHAFPSRRIPRARRR